MSQSRIYTICRLCLCNGPNLLDVFEGENGAVFDVKKVIEELLQLEVVNTAMYPWNVCSVCVGKLIEFNFFKRRCVENQEVYDGRIMNAQGEEQGGNEVDEVSVKLEDDNVPNETPYEVSCWNIAPADGYESQVVLSNTHFEFSANPKMDGEVSGHEMQTDMPRDMSIHVVKVEPTNEEVYGDSRVIQKDQKSDKDSSVEDANEDLNTANSTETSSISEKETGSSMANDSWHSQARRGTLREKFICDKCGHSYVSKTSLLKHIMGHEKLMGKNEGRGQCQKNVDGFPFINCRAVFNSREHLDSDLVKEHPEFHCNYCRKAYIEKVQLISHICSVHLKVQGRTYQPGLTKGRKEKRKKLFPCDHCGKVFRFNCRLLHHVKSLHLGLKPFYCQVCSKSFSEKGNLKGHIRRVHIGEQGFECEECMKAFKSSMELKNHMLTHLDIRPFPCSLCPRSFVRANFLKSHMESHGEVIHSCDICGKGFKQAGLLRQHRRWHSEDRPYKCTQCPKAFKTRPCLTDHEVVHSGLRVHSCKVCGKKFSHSRKLKRHMTSHDGKRPYVCSVCSKSFSQRGHLNEHLKIHNQNREMFRCDVCGKSMTTKQSLERHLKKVHGQF